MRFPWRDQAIDGTVAELQRARAVVAAGADARWKVPYRLLTVVERVRERECTLAEVEKLAAGLLARHQAGSGLHADWGFGFDLSTARAGVCRYADKRIDLSVSYCLRATRAEIEDTLLHEIAHAIVGHRHHHDAVWKAVARALGCTAERCHDVAHTPARWLGECGCGQTWRRHRLRPPPAAGCALREVRRRDHVATEHRRRGSAVRCQRLEFIPRVVSASVGGVPDSRRRKLVRSGKLPRSGSRRNRRATRHSVDTIREPACVPGGPWGTLWWR